MLITCSKTKSTNDDLISLIPQNTDIIVRINDINSLINKFQNDELLKNLNFPKTSAKKLNT